MGFLKVFVNKISQLPTKKIKNYVENNFLKIYKFYKSKLPIGTEDIGYISTLFFGQRIIIILLLQNNLRKKMKKNIHLILP